MTDAKRSRSRRLYVALAVAGIAVEAIALWLLAGKHITNPVAVPLIISGMFLAFVPIFVVARSARR